MLTVHDAQLFVFRAAAARRFEDRMTDYLRHTYPALHAELGAAAAQALVRHGMAVARQQGIDGVGGVSVLIDLMARFGQGFENSGAADWIVQMLARTDLPGAVRIESIIQHVNAKTGGRVLVRAAAADNHGV